MPKLAAKISVQSMLLFLGTHPESGAPLVRMMVDREEYAMLTVETGPRVVSLIEDLATCCDVSAIVGTAFDRSASTEQNQLVVSHDCAEVGIYVRVSDLPALAHMMDL